MVSSAEDDMSMQDARGRAGYLAYTDGFANRSQDFLLLVGRVFLGWLLLASGWGKLGNMAGFTTYLTNLKVPGSGFWAWIAAPVEFLVGAALILGIATRYAAVVGFIFVLIATALAHRYWEYPPAQVVAQYNNFLKNISIMGGMIFVFVTGAGRYAMDRVLMKR
jgi:putative oxidoreductase